MGVDDASDSRLEAIVRSFLDDWPVDDVSAAQLQALELSRTAVRAAADLVMKATG